MIVFRLLFFSFRSTFVIFYLFWTMNVKVATIEGFEPPILWFQVGRLIRLAMRPVEESPNFDFFCSECILWAVRWYGGIRSFLSSHRVHFLLFARSWSLFNSSPVWTTIEIFNYFPTKKLKITTTGRFLQSSDSKPDALSVWLLGLLRAFPILFSCIQWLRWIVKWHSMLPVVSLLPSVTIWMMIVSWLHFFRLEPGLASTSFWQWIWKLLPQRGSNTQWSVSKSDALYGTLFDLARWFRFRFFIVNDYEEV